MDTEPLAADDRPGGGDGTAGPSAVPPGIDAGRSSAAGIYDYILGGTHHSPADREVAEQLKAMIPVLVELAWANRGFHQRAVRWLAEVQGIDQFIDLGSGLPTQNNTHQIAQRAAPHSHVVYIDNDPSVAAHGAELLDPEGNTAVVTGDLRDPEGVLAHPELRRLIDFDRPVALLMTAILHFVPDEADPWGKVARLTQALCSGSYLVLSHGTIDRWHRPETVERVQEQQGRSSTGQSYPRTKAEVERFFAGLDLVPPYPGAEAAVTYAGLWGAEDPEAADDDPARWIYAAVGRKP